MQIIKLICIIHKLVNVVYEKIVYEDITFVNENLYIIVKACLFAQAIFHKIINISIQTDPKCLHFFLETKCLHVFGLFLSR